MSIARIREAAKPRGRPGLTLLEILLVVVVAAALTAIVAPQVSRVHGKLAVTNARTAFLGLSARARTAALERGVVARLRVDPATDRAVLVVGSDTVETVEFQDDFVADVTVSAEAGLTVCYSPRGFALPSCSVGLDSEAVVTFARGRDSVQARVRPLGQVERL